MEQIYKDIEENMDAVLEIEETSYRPVFTEYQGKYENFRAKFLDFDVEPIDMKKIEFAGVP